MRIALVFLVLVGSLAPAVAGELLEVQDLSYHSKPFDPGDYGMVQRISLRDHDADNPWDVFLTRVSVENVGTAVPEEITEVKVELRTERGTFLIAESGGFPVVATLLDMPPESRSIPDDTDALLVIRVRVGDRLTDGHTLRTKVYLWFSEGKEGGQAEALDGAPEGLLMKGVFRVQVLTGQEGGVLNPGDSFPIMAFRVEDAPDVNFAGLYLSRISLTAPTGLHYKLYNHATWLPLKPGANDLSQPYFAALDEGIGELELWAEVPPDYRAEEPLKLAPSLEITVKEGANERTFRLQDPAADEVVAAGAEELVVEIPKGGAVLEALPGVLDYSVLHIGDRDRNATGITLEKLALIPKGTLKDAIKAVEITDDKGNLIAYSQDPSTIPLVDPRGKELLLNDDGEKTLDIRLYLEGKAPVGASLLLEHDLSLAEVHPYRTTPTSFRGTQRVVPEKAIFIGKPSFRLRPSDHGVVLVTTGGTIGEIQGTLVYSPTEHVLVSGPKAFHPYTLVARGEEDGEVPFRLRCTGTPEAGELLEVGFSLEPVRLTGPVTLTVQVELGEVVDTAGIELPYNLDVSSVSIPFPVPQVGLWATVQGLEVRVGDQGILSLAGEFHFDPPELAQQVTLKAVDPFALVSAQPGPEGVVTFRLEASAPGSGPALDLLFPEEAQGTVRIVISEILGEKGQPLPYILEPEEATLVVE